jgi:hypothetical protein
MSQTHAHPDKSAKPSESTEKAIQDLDAHILGESPEKLPAPDEGGHARSHAAHPDVTGHADTKPAGDLRRGLEPGALRQPPQEVSRSGKQDRR